MIPGNITSAHIIDAIKEIDRDGVIAHRNSKHYALLFEGKIYPPKYVVSIANRYANGKELCPYDFSGGSETNNFLRKRGFEIINDRSR